jgi:hypothetical protein
MTASYFWIISHVFTHLGYVMQDLRDQKPSDRSDTKKQICKIRGTMIAFGFPKRDYCLRDATIVFYICQLFNTRYHPNMEKVDLSTG